MGDGSQAPGRAITRRAALATGAATAAAALAAGALGGCMAQDEEAEGAMLPLGSVVVIKGFEGSGIKHVVVDRCPYVSKAISYDSDGNAVEKDSDTLPDYAVVYYPLGFMGDHAEAPIKAAEFYIAESSISEVVFRGYSDDLELRASELLDQGRQSGIPSPMSLHSLLEEIASDGEEG